MTFNEVEATTDFANQLGPPPAEFITQTQGDAPTAGNIPRHPPPPGAPAELKVPNLVAIPNMLIDLLRNQGSAVTPYNVLASIDDFVQQSGEL